MAKQKGIIKLKGTIGDITLYKTTMDGILLVEKGVLKLPGSKVTQKH